MNYLDKAAAHKDRRYASILEQIGYKRRDMRPAPAPASNSPPSNFALENDLDKLRAAYQALKGRAPAASWGVEKIRRLLAEAQS